VRSIPSDGALRSCATYLLLVTKAAGDGVPDRLAMKQDGLAVLAGSSVILPQSVVLDNGLNVLNKDLSDLTMTSQENLGTVKDGVYTAGSKAGTDTLRLSSGNLGVTGTAQIHVVDALTSFAVSQSGNSSALTALSVKPGATVQLAVTGSYWNRAALRDWGPVAWTVTGEVGTVSQNGLFTASSKAVSGTITASAGGLTQTIQVATYSVHQDVTEDHWAYEAEEYCYGHGIVCGISATEFGRDNQIRRGDFMLMLYNAVGRPQVTSNCTFTDVTASDYYYTALSWAQSAGLASGTGNGAYSPGASITREQAFTILRQAMPLLGKECPTGSLTVLDQFSDKDQIADYAKGHTATLVSQGVVSGKGTGIDPKGNLTRAEMAALLYKLITYTPIMNTNPDSNQPDTPDASQYTLTINKVDFTLQSGESFPLLATLAPAVEGAEITWSSSSPTAAVVTDDGVVTNLFPGTGTSVATITASWNGTKATCIVYCKQANLTGTVIHAETGLNVRSGPDASAAVVGGLANGTQVVVLGVENGWCHVLYLSKDNQAAIGYVSGDYIQLSH
ncbi:MAG: S-layer homology domain-containing protein, partial [Lawsonibacter sp.]|nr:S-layer homology domain-containing protein [Lawsonibacter sp.]